MSTANWETCWLVCHPDTATQPKLRIGAEVGRKGNGHICAEFRALGRQDCIRWPKRAHPDGDRWSRRDGLWQSTCFEIFVKPRGSAEYLEYNFASTCEWAGYEFDDYRAGMRESVSSSIAKASWQMRAERVKFTVVLALPPGYGERHLDIALAAITEETDGTKSYWALAHPPGKPDFHHPACFAATLPAPQAP